MLIRLCVYSCVVSVSEGGKVERKHQFELLELSLNFYGDQN